MNQIFPLKTGCRLIPTCKITPWIAAVMILASISIAGAQETFKTPEDAVTALVNAAKDGWPQKVIAMLGPSSVDLVSSGDKVADEATRQKYLTAYNEKHSVALEGENKATLIIGAQDFPFPIPLVRKGEAWSFDAAAGRREILYRRIGRNEIAAMQASLAYVDAQNEYAEKRRAETNVAAYAQRIISQPGKKDGLYWPVRPGEEQSPLGELVAQAATEGYQASGGREPFHGYYFKILTRQGAAAPGGALDYVVRGEMIGGFALLAYPAEYGNSGVMTFIVNHTGTMYEKNLGPSTAKVASKITSFDPDRSWQKVDVDEQK